MFTEMISYTRNQYHKFPEIEAAFYRILTAQMNLIALDQQNALDNHYYDGPHCTKFTVYGGCARQSVYRIQNFEKDNAPDAHGYGNFIAGYSSEAVLRASLIQAGFTLSYESGWFGEISVRPDAVIHLTANQAKDFEAAYDMQCDHTRPLVLECKTMHNKSFAKVRDEGLKVAKPNYYHQVQLQIAALQVKYGVVLCVNKNTGTLYEEIVVRDATLHLQLEAHYKKILAAESPGVYPRKFDLVPQTTYQGGKKDPGIEGSVSRINSRGFVYGWDIPTGESILSPECKYCPFRGTCWSDYNLTESGWEIAATPCEEEEINF